MIPCNLLHVYTFFFSEKNFLSFVHLSKGSTAQKRLRTPTRSGQVRSVNGRRLLLPKTVLLQNVAERGVRHVLRTSEPTNSLHNMSSPPSTSPNEDTPLSPHSRPVLPKPSPIFQRRIQRGLENSRFCASLFRGNPLIYQLPDFLRGPFWGTHDCTPSLFNP